MALVCIFEGSDKGGDAEEMTDEKFKDLVIQYEKLVFTVCYQLSMIITSLKTSRRKLFLPLTVTLIRIKEKITNPG